MTFSVFYSKNRNRFLFFCLRNYCKNCRDGGEFFLRGNDEDPVLSFRHMDCITQFGRLPESVLEYCWNRVHSDPENRSVREIWWDTARQKNGDNSKSQDDEQKPAAKKKTKHSSKKTEENSTQQAPGESDIKEGRQEEDAARTEQPTKILQMPS